LRNEKIFSVDDEGLRKYNADFTIYKKEQRNFFEASLFFLLIVQPKNVCADIRLQPG